MSTMAEEKEEYSVSSLGFHAKHAGKYSFCYVNIKNLFSHIGYLNGSHSQYLKYDLTIENVTFVD